MPEPTPTHSRCFALVPCAGVGQRAGQGGPKQYTYLAGKAVVQHTLDTLAAVPRLLATLVVLAPDDAEFERHAPHFSGPRAWLARVGGATRAATVQAGLAELQKRGATSRDWVLVHDAARCLLQAAWVDRLIDHCLTDEVGGLLALPVADTVKQQGDVAQPRVAKTLDRNGKWLAQTPQMFRLGVLQRALQQAGADVTDESGAVEALGLAPLLITGELENFKLTWPGDFALAARLLSTRQT
jgi:2-C-methyl-D-erythritol 4-phosphate cytidylyltransferase